MEAWAPLSHLRELQHVFAAAAEAEEKDASWFYIDGNTGTLPRFASSEVEFFGLMFAPPFAPCVAEKQGPFDKDVLLQMRRAHQIKDHTPVWNINMGITGKTPLLSFLSLAASPL
jgi:hypothetical protein